MEEPASAEASITFCPFRADKRPAEGFGMVGLQRFAFVLPHAARNRQGFGELPPKNARVRAVRPGCAFDCVVFDVSRAHERQFRDVDGLAAEVLHTLAFFLVATSRNRCRLSGDVANRRAMSLLANRQPANRSPAQKARPRDPQTGKPPRSQPSPTQKAPRSRGLRPASISFSRLSRGSSSRLRRRWACSRCWSM